MRHLPGRWPILSHLDFSQPGWFRQSLRIGASHGGSTPFHPPKGLLLTCLTIYANIDSLWKMRMCRYVSLTFLGPK